MIALAIGALLFAGPAMAFPVVWNQGFETGTDGWFDYDSIVSQASSGTNGIASAAGDYHALLTAPDVGNTGAFTRFDGYRDTWTGGLVTSTDFYCDVNWALGTGFEYSVAANGSDGNHQRDFIFHITKDTSTGDLLVGGSNNSNFEPREDLETLQDHAVIGASGWYTLQHVFYEDNGILSVDMNLFSTGGDELFNTTRTDAGDVISEIGGNRYGWVTVHDIDGPLALDNNMLATNDVPEPGTISLLAIGLGGLGVVTIRRRRR